MDQTINEVAIILVNYNRTDDTIECILSLLNNSYANIRIIVVDNNSDEKNKEKFRSWFAGNYSPVINPPKSISAFVKNDFQFPIAFKEINYSFESIGKNSENGFEISKQGIQTIEQKIIYVCNSSNNGFAGANNIGMKLSIELNCKYVWLLNNDTVIESNALKELVGFAEELKQHGENPGMIGSKVLFYDEPELIQSLGGKFNPITSKNIHVGYLEQEKKFETSEPLKIDYPYGAAFFIESDFISEVGLMNEDYFLYYEELDWVTRGARKKIPVRVCLNSKVYHKQGVSTGKKMGKPLSDFTACLHYRNRLKFYRRFYPVYLPVTASLLFFKMVKCFFTNRKPEAKIIFKILTGFSNCNVYESKID